MVESKMGFQWCESRNQRIDERVCLHNLETGRCTGTMGACQQAKETRDLSDEERKRRSDRMKEINRRNGENQRKKLKSIEDTDVEGVKENEVI